MLATEWSRDGVEKRTDTGANSSRGWVLKFLFKVDERRMNFFLSPLFFFCSPRYKPHLSCCTCHLSLLHFLVHEFALYSALLNVPLQLANMHEQSEAVNTRQKCHPSFNFRVKLYFFLFSSFILNLKKKKPLSDHFTSERYRGREFMPSSVRECVCTCKVCTL